MFTIPAPFREAVKALQSRGLMPTRLKSEELARLNADLLRSSFFSAQTLITDLLDQYQRKLGRLINPVRVQRPDRVTPDNPDGWVTEGTTDAEIRLQTKQLLDRIGYQADPDKEGTIEDLRSDARINLVIRTNAEMSQGYGWWEQGQDPDVLLAFPCQELYRVEQRVEKRKWSEIWRGNGGRIFAGQSPGLPLDPGFSEGRLIARKDDPIWFRISRFGNPYPPFDFNSGVDVRDVGYREAVELGVIERGDQVTPQSLPFPQRKEVA